MAEKKYKIKSESLLSIENLQKKVLEMNEKIYHLKKLEESTDIIPSTVKNYRNFFFLENNLKRKGIPDEIQQKIKERKYQQNQISGRNKELFMMNEFSDNSSDDNIEFKLLEGEKNFGQIKKDPDDKLDIDDKEIKSVKIHENEDGEVHFYKFNSLVQTSAYYKCLFNQCKGRAKGIVIIKNLEDDKKKYILEKNIVVSLNNKMNEVAGQGQREGQGQRAWPA